LVFVMRISCLFPLSCEMAMYLQRLDHGDLIAIYAMLTAKCNAHSPQTFNYFPLFHYYISNNNLICS